MNIGFHKYCTFFESTENNSFSNFPISIQRTNFKLLDYLYSNIFKNWVSITNKIFGKSITLYKFYCLRFKEDVSSTIFDLNKTDFIENAKNKKILVHGWMFRDEVNIRKHRDKLLVFFKPVEPYCSQINEDINNAREKADVLIGVHIRRGDYSVFKNGIWFYSDFQFANFMHQIKSLYALENKTCAFFICSNDEIDINVFENLLIVFKKRHFIVDLYCLSKCDLIIGQPSTYSQWAAFYGNIPLLMLLNQNQKIEIPKLNSTFLPEEDFEDKILFKF